MSADLLNGALGTSSCPSWVHLSSPHPPCEPGACATCTNPAQLILSQCSGFMEAYFFFLFFFLIYIFIFGCFGSLLLRVGFLQLLRAGATLHCGVRASHCGGFSCCDARASIVVVRGLSSCGAGAQLFCSMWDLPGPGLKPMSPALAGRFLTTAPPGKSLVLFWY